MRIRWTATMSVAVVAFAIVAAIFQFNAWLVALSIVVAVVSVAVSTEQETKKARAEHIKRQLDELYGPWAQIAKMRLQHEMPDFRQYMTHELGELRLHLAEPATLAAYLRLEREGKWGGSEELELARAFLSDHGRLVEEYHRLTGMP